MINTYNRPGAKSASITYINGPRAAMAAPASSVPATSGIQRCQAGIEVDYKGIGFKDQSDNYYSIYPITGTSSRLLKVDTTGRRAVETELSVDDLWHTENFNPETKEDVGVAVNLVSNHENTWDHNLFLTELPDHNSLSGLDVGDYRHLSATHKTDLTDGGDSSLHYHSTDRNRANHTGTQAINTINELQSTLDNKQPLNSKLTDIAALSVTSGNFIIGNGTTFVSRKLQNSDLPAIAITDTFVVASQAAMLALSAAERGDVAVRSDLNKSFILKGDDPATLGDWQELLTPTDAVLSVDGRTGVVSLSDKYQPLDTDLTAIAGLTHSNRHVLISDGSTWTRRALVAEDIPNLSAAKITSGTLDNARLSFDPSSFANLSLGSVQATGGFATSLETGRDVFASGLYTYRFMGDALNKPAGISLGSVLTWGRGGAGAGQLAVGWTSGDHNKLVFRSLRDTQNDWWDWKEIYHTGNFDPSTFAPAAHVHPIGEVTNLQTTLDGKLDNDHVSNTVHNYRSVYTIRFTGVTHNTTGTLKINLPSSWSNVRYRFEMRGYAYSNNFNTYGSWRYVGSGFAYSPDSRWYLQGGQFLEGNPSFNQVRYTHDGSRCCILLGNTTTTWTDHTTFPVVIDIDVITDAPISRDGWSFEVLTSEGGYAWGNIQSTTISIYGRNATIPNTALIGKTTATGGYKLEVEGNALVNGNETITGDIDVGGNLQTRNNISLLNKAGNGWLSFATRDVSGSEAVADLSNVRSITPAGSALKVSGDIFLWNKLQLINRAGDAWDVIDRETGGNGIGARLKNITMLNDMSVGSSSFSNAGTISLSATTFDVNANITVSGNITLENHTSGIANLLCPNGFDMRAGSGVYRGAIYAYDEAVYLSVLNRSSFISLNGNDVSVEGGTVALQGRVTLGNVVTYNTTELPTNNSVIRITVAPLNATLADGVEDGQIVIVMRGNYPPGDVVVEGVPIVGMRMFIWDYDHWVCDNH